MNIQVVSEFYYPDNFRINEIVQELVVRGNEINVITALPDYTTGRVPKKYKRFKNKKEMIFGAQTVRIFSVERRTGMLRRVLSYISFMVNSSLHCLFCQKPDCDSIFVYETSPIFQALPAIILKKRTSKKLVLYCCDLWPESLKAWKIKERSLIYKIVGKFSSWLYKQCDVVAITSEPFSDYLTKVCRVDENKIVYLPQHCNDDYYDIVGQHIDDNCFDFMFAGNLGAVQNVDCIVLAVSQMRTSSEFCVHIVGDGSEMKTLKRMVKNMDLEDKVIFHGRHPLEKMKCFYKKADCFLLTLRGGDSIGMTLPSKMQSYLCAGKPIVAAIDGAAAKVIHEADCGLRAPAGNSKALAELMDKVIDEFETFKIKGENGRKFYDNNYTKDIFMNNLLKILND